MKIATAGTFSTTTKKPRDPRKRHDRADTRKHHGVIGVSEFVGIDGEGMTVNGEHRYVLLGVGDNQIEDPKGLDLLDILPFVNAHYKERRAITGFFLGYDFGQWFKTMPEDRARMLLTEEGRKLRVRRNLGNDPRTGGPPKRLPPHPVDYREWQLDMLGTKRLKFRHKPCKCKLSVCPCPKGPWVYVCDTGPFFQTSLLKVIDPRGWPEPIVTDEEYRQVLAGKERRDSAVLDDEMRYYNVLENRILARVLKEYDRGLRNVGVVLSKGKWFGPGQAAQAWLKGRAPKRESLDIPPWFIDAAIASYFGGWFELMMHGLIPGETHEYDINSAYPHIIAKLPCLQHGHYSRGTGKPPARGNGLCLVRALVWSQSYAERRRKYHIGAMLHRDGQGRISRPMITEGWFWEHELAAATRAGIVTRVTDDRYTEWVKYDPCDCDPPMREVSGLYDHRLRVGKNTPLGKGAKAIYNSEYGKFAQSVGEPIFGNPVYASLITAGCRSQILDAIATHPMKTAGVIMVATDAVYFLEPHPGLTISERLGDWDYATKSNLTVFKPGVYWDDRTRANIRAGRSPEFKARGINAADLGRHLERLDQQFASWAGKPPAIADEKGKLAGWPEITLRPAFAMVTPLQALRRNDWSLAGYVSQPGKEVKQSSNPDDKRCDVYYDKNQGVYRSEPHWFGNNGGIFGGVVSAASVPYEKRFGMEDPFSDEYRSQSGIDPDGFSLDGFIEILGAD
jgi:hypothetical protein